MTIEKLFCRVLGLLLFMALHLFQPSLATASDPQVDYTDPTTGMEFVLVLGGSFIMGNDSVHHASAENKVKVQTFYLGKHEVTFAEYDLYCQDTGTNCPDDSGWGREQRPVINVSWNDAVAFTTWLSAKTGRSFRLPTEAEWEYAAQGGESTAYPWGETVGTGNANCRDCLPSNGGKTSPVGSFPPNKFGLHDIAGNVYEWCLDSLNASKSETPVDGSPNLGDAQNHKITRSGSWSRNHLEMRTFQRCWDPPKTRNDEIGFRVLMEI